MPRFHPIGFLFIIYVLSLFFYGKHQEVEIPFFAYFLPACFLFAFILNGVVNINSNFFVKAICEGKSHEKIVALTFDDGPNPLVTSQVLDFLKKNNLPATFFLIGSKIEGQEQILRRMDAEGHLIGNHSFSHTVGFDFKFSPWVRRELQVTQKLVENVIGKKMRWFRPPFGITNPYISTAVSKENYQVIGWNVRPYDGVLKDKNIILNNIKKALKANSIILLHDIKPLILEILEELLPYLKNEGYRVVALDQLIHEEAYF